MWNDRIYKKVTIFVKLSFVGILVLWAGAGLHNIPMIVLGSLFSIVLFGFATYLFLKMIWGDID